MNHVIRRNLLSFGLALAVGVPAVSAAPAPARAAKPAERTVAAGTRHTAPVGQALRDAMRKLWTDHVVWTREYVVAAVDGSPSANAAAKRLMKNQEDIGAAIVPYYGAQAGDRLTALLKEHIAIAVDLVHAAKTNNTGAFDAANRKWKQNASDIAAFLAKANPSWPAPALADAMTMHLETTTREVVARLQKKYDDDVAAFDAVYDHILHMADVLADGIVRQFPDRFAN